MCCASNAHTETQWWQYHKEVFCQQVTHCSLRSSEDTFRNILTETWIVQHKHTLHMTKNLTNRLQASRVFLFQFVSTWQSQPCCVKMKSKRSAIIQNYMDSHWSPPHGRSCYFSQKSEGLLLFSWSYCMFWYMAGVSHWERWHLTSSLWVEPATGLEQGPATAFELGENGPSIF